MDNLRGIVGILLILSTIILPTTALTDTFQEYDTVSYPIYVEWPHYQGSLSSQPYSVRNHVNWPYYDTQVLYTGFDWTGAHSFSYKGMTYSTTRCLSNYMAFTMAYEYNSHTDNNIYFFKGTSSVGSADLDSAYSAGYKSWDRYEFERDGSDVMLYCDGVNLGDVGSLSDNFDTIEFWARAPSTVAYSRLYIDNYIQGYSIPNVIGSLPVSYYIMNNPSQPDLTGVYNSAGTMLDTNHFHTTWATTKDIYPIDYGDLRVDTICLSTAQTINTTYLNTTKVIPIWGENTTVNNQAGVIEYDLDTLLVEPHYPYGQYVQQLTLEDEVLDVDYFWYLGGGANLEFSQDEYTIGETLSLNYTISGFNTTQYDYTLKIIDLYGHEYDSKILNLEEAHVVFTTNSDVYSNGQYYAIINAIPKGEIEPITLAFDTVTLNEIVKIRGIVYDAISEEVLEDVQVSCLQGSGYFNGTSDSSGNYEIENLIVNSIVSIDAIKENYSFKGITFTPLDTGIFSINLYLVPDNMSYEGSAIYGFCYLYPYNQGLNASSVSIEGEGLSHIEVSNTLGFYLINLSSSIENEVQNIPNNTIIDQNISCAFLETWYNLNYNHINNIQVSNLSNFSYLYNEIIDYTINYTEGRISLPMNSSIELNTSYYMKYDIGTPFILNQTHLVPYKESISSINGSIVYTLGDYEINYTAGTFLAYPEGNIEGNISLDYDYAYFGDVTLSSTSTGYTPSENISLVVEAGDIIEQDFEFSSDYNITIEIRNLDDETLIFDEVHIECSDGQVLNTTTAGSTFNLEYGMYSFSASATGYLSSSCNILVDSDKSQTLYLDKYTTSSGGAGVYYPPHGVRFIVRDIYGTPQSGITITAEYSESSGPLEWLTDLLGMSEEADVTNATLSGSTGIDGSITFTMVETIKYEITMTEEGSSSPFLTFGLYPKQDEYSFTLVNPLSGIGGKDLYKDINWTLSSERSSDYLNVSLQFYYEDTLENTEEVEFYVLNATSREKLYSEVAIDQDILNCSYSVNNTRGDQYIWGFNATHVDFGDFGEANVITLQGPTGRLIDLGLYGEDEGWYNWISAILIVLMAGGFGARRSRYGLIAVPIWADMLFFIGWMPAVSILIMITGTAAGVLSYISLGEGKII